MAKRSFDEARPDNDERIAKKLKKKAEAGGDDTNTSSEKKQLSKAERKAIKKAYKEQQKLKTESTSDNTAATGQNDPEAVAEAERKALRRAEKAAKKAAKEARKNVLNEQTSDDSTPPATSAATSTAISTRQSPDLVDDAAYREHAGLTAVPQTEIDTFVKEKMLAVDDPLNQHLRPLVSFDYLPIDDPAQRAYFAKFSSPTPIQAACWPYLFARRDVVGVAETGSGKTLAFGVPCVRYINRLGKKGRKGIRACIVSPTRELAMQIYEQLSKLAQPAGLKATCVYGGMSKDDQRAELKGTQIVVATPGRLNDFIQEGSIDLSQVGYLVLDEADRMLDKGFEDEVRKIISTTPSSSRQTLMFTATWPQSVRNLASTFMDRPVKVTIGDNASGELRANTRIVQEVRVVEEMEKQTLLIQLLKKYQSGAQKKDRILVFCLYKKEATRIEEFIRRKGFPVAGIHGDLNQKQRTESLEAFKEGRVPLLVATDVAARGLDIPAVKVVINVTFPLTVEDYVHRIGRTGRAGQDGIAVTLFTQTEKGLAGGLINVLKAANQPVPEELLKFGTTVKKKGHDAYGAFFRDTADMKKATKITFD